MSDERDDPGELLDDARAELDARVDPGAKARLLQRLEAARGGGPAGGGPAGSPPGGAGLTAASVATHVALALVTGVLGYFAHAWTHPVTTRVVTRERVVRVPVERVVEVVRAVPAPAVDAAVAAPAPQRPPAVEDQLGAEQWLIDQASASLREGRPAAALAATEEHRRRFPRGQLRAIREVLRAEGLAASGRIEEARAVARGAMGVVGEGPLRARLRALTREGDAH